MLSAVFQSLPDISAEYDTRLLKNFANWENCSCEILWRGSRIWKGLLLSLIFGRPSRSKITIEIQIRASYPSRAEKKVSFQNPKLYDVGYKRGEYVTNMFRPQHRINPPVSNRAKLCILRSEDCVKSLIDFPITLCQILLWKSVFTKICRYIAYDLVMTNVVRLIVIYVR